MIDYKDLKMKCTSSHPQEPFYTEGKEYDIETNSMGCTWIRCITNYHDCYWYIPI